MKSSKKVKIKWISLILLLVFLFALPYIITDGYQLRVINSVLLYSILAVAVNLAGGYGGQLVMGHACYVGIGAYTTAILSVRYGLSFGATFLLSILFAGIYGLITGILCLCRVKGDHVMIVTMGVSEITRIFFMNAKELTGGPVGITQIPGIQIGGYRFFKSSQYYYVFLILLIVTIILVHRIVNSRFGRAVVAVREDETAARAMGIKINQTKVITFAISTLFAGMVGALQAHYNMFIGPSQFNLDEGLLYYQMIIIGGMGSIPGSVAGAAILTLIPEVFRGVQEYRTILYGLIMVIMMVVKPEGLFGHSGSNHLIFRISNMLKSRIGKRSFEERKSENV